MRIATFGVRIRLCKFSKPLIEDFATYLLVNVYHFPCVSIIINLKMESTTSAHYHTRYSFVSYFYLVHDELYWYCILNPIDNKI